MIFVDIFLMKFMTKSQVRPELLLGSFTCRKCGREYHSVEQQCQYTEPQICLNPTCQSADFQLLMDNSVFVDWQRLRVQENADEIPAGSMPRCVDVICRGAVVETAKAGDKVIFTGTVAVVTDVTGLARAGDAATGRRGSRRSESSSGEGVLGLKKLGVREMTYKILFIACSVRQVPASSSSSSAASISDCASSSSRHARRRLTSLAPLLGGEMNNALDSEYDVGNRVGDDGQPSQRHRDAHDAHDAAVADLTIAQRDDIARMRSTPHLYAKMVESICPTVFGHTEVKRGVLLMLFGGVHKRTPEGASLRGDINVCIVGDPSCAKSQFLKYVHGFLPRAIYTSGKSSSAAGLTASVAKDPETVDNMILLDVSIIFIMMCVLG